MAIFISVLCSLTLGYLLGSISNGVLIGKIFYGIDIREKGSHNAGGTNTGRVLGKKAGLMTIILDVLKTIIAVWSTLFICRIEAINNLIVIDASYYAYIAGLGAAIGHTFPIFFKFKGGKAVACLGGICIATNWIITLIGLVIFMLVLVISKYVSLSSIVGSISIGVLSYIPFVRQYGMMFKMNGDIYFSLLMTFLAIYVIIRHYSNIIRLFNHTESKIKWLGKNNN